MKVLILGAGGMLGTDVVGAARAAGLEVRALDRSDLDVTIPERVNEVFHTEVPEAVINCAAWTDVDRAEEEPGAAEEVNVEGAANVARAADEVGARVLYVSSDYVFDGSKDSPYLESDRVAPLSVYGRSKALGEEMTLSGNQRSFVVRTSWLFGTGGSNFVETMLRLGSEDGQVRVVDDQVGCPTWTGHLADGLIQLIDSERFGVHHMAAAGRCSWYEFAREIFDQAGMAVTVDPASTAEFDRKANRPAFSALESERREAIELPSWRAGLSAYLDAGAGDLESRQ